MKDQIKTRSKLSNVSMISIPMAKDQNDHFHRFGIPALTVAVNKGLKLLQDPERAGVAVVGVVFSSLGTDFRSSEFFRGLIVITILKS